jgi:phosphoribosylformylglycinamidine cyclo-ligase
VGRVLYDQAGVGDAGPVLSGLLTWVQKTNEFRRGIGAPRVGLGHYATVLDLGNNLGLALSTDGVGTKLLLAEMADRYDTVGIDCVAMNVNDLLCVGAEPLAMLDYVAVQRADAGVLEALGRGLYEGAKQANITIPGGELAQLREMVQGIHPDSGLDLVGTCVGTVALDKMILGDALQPGDVVVGLASSGLHSNGYTLARRALLDKGGMKLERHVGELGRTLGDELLEPTRIYVKPMVEMWRKGVRVRAMAHITGDGFLNLRRLSPRMGYTLDALPDVPPIFNLIKERGGVPIEEMYRVFNMGVGFCLIVPESDVAPALSIARDHGVEGWPIGRTLEDADRTVTLTAPGLKSQDDSFVPAA